MEFPGLGKRCADNQCKKLDFLPLECKKCAGVFCSEHLSEHGCREERWVEEGQLKRIEVEACAREECRARAVVLVECERCKKRFCVKHRHFDQCVEKSPEQIEQEKSRYRDPQLKFEAAKNAVEQQVSLNLAQAKKKVKTRQLACKVQLMKIKNKASGLKTIPSTDRVYFNVHVQGGPKVVPIFVAKTWSLGRAIDAIADQCQMLNFNNKVNERKLRLFRKDGGKLEEDMGHILDNLLKDEVLIDGDDLVIDYV